MSDGVIFDQNRNGGPGVPGGLDHNVEMKRAMAGDASEQFNKDVLERDLREWLKGSVGYDRAVRLIRLYFHSRERANKWLRFIERCRRDNVELSLKATEDEIDFIVEFRIMLILEHSDKIKDMDDAFIRLADVLPQRRTSETIYGAVQWDEYLEGLIHDGNKG